VLRIHSFPVMSSSFGRYHALGGAPIATNDRDPSPDRRAGCACRSGVSCSFSLLLPHRSAFFSDDPYNLAPFQVLNRYARPILQGLKAEASRCFTPT